MGQGTSGETVLSDAGLFVARYTHEGELVWAWASDGLADGIDIDRATNGDLCLLARTWASQDIGPPGGRVTLPAIAAQDTAVARISSAGDVLWAATVTGTDSQDPKGICWDAAGGLVFCLYNAGDYDIKDASGAVSSGSTSGPFGGLVVVLTSDGDLIEGKALSGSNGVLSAAVCGRSEGGFHLMGYYSGTARLASCGPVDGLLSVSANYPQPFFATYQGPEETE